MRGACAAADPWQGYRQKFRVFFREALLDNIPFKLCKCFKDVEDQCPASSLDSVPEWRYCSIPERHYCSTCKEVAHG